MKRLGLLLFGLCGWCAAGEPASVQVKGRWAKQGCVALADLKDFKPSSGVALDRYGGWAERTEKATGFFHTARVNGRWWLVDPDGNLFLCAGVNSVSPADAKGGTASSAATNGVPDDRMKAMEQAVGLLRKNGFNMLGCWSDTDANRRLSAPLPYCLRWNFMSTYRRERLKRYPVPGEIEAIYPFDPEFERFCDEHARGLEETRNDPLLVGHFSDNELPFHEGGIVARYLGHPPADPCHTAAAAYMASRRRDKPDRTDDREFLRLVVSEYYRKVAAAIRRHDPNHLFLGSRFHGLALASPSLMTGAGPHADVVSVNYYNRWTPEKDRIREWARLSGKPILVTEWYAQAADSGLPNSAGAGFRVRAQVDRARFYQHFTLTLLGNPACVGWHWFKFRDSAVNNPGVVNAKDEPYVQLLDAMQQVNTRIYALSAFLGRE